MKSNKNRTTRDNRAPRDEMKMPHDYPVVSLDQVIADGTAPWTLNVVARRIGYKNPSQAAQLRRGARQLAAINDNRERRAV